MFPVQHRNLTQNERRRQKTKKRSYTALGGQGEGKGEGKKNESCKRDSQMASVSVSFLKKKKINHF